MKYFFQVVSLLGLGTPFPWRLPPIVSFVGLTRKMSQAHYQTNGWRRRSTISHALRALVMFFAAITFAPTAPVNAQADVEGPDCTGTVVRVQYYVTHNGSERLQHAVTLDPHGDEVCSPKWVTDLNSEFGKQILKTCPFGSHCHIKGVYSNHGIEEITKVERVPATSTAAHKKVRK